MKKDKKWEIRGGLKNRKNSKLDVGEIIDILLKNRGVSTQKEKEEFLNPVGPEKIGLKEIGINTESVKKTIKRIQKAIKNKEQIIIYGDYDTDGVCATAILWETLYSLTKNVTPYIPDRFSEGYGINAESIDKLKIKNKKLKIVITVDNGIVANEAVKKANELGIDVIITDHHEKGKKLPKAFSIVHTEKLSGSGVAWVMAREIRKSLQLPISNPQLNKKLKIDKLENSLETGNWKMEISSGLELAAIGTIADQLPLIGPNRSIAKYGLEALNQTKRPGLLAIFEEAGIRPDSTRLSQGLAWQVGTYEINYIIAPRLNAMGRMEHAIDSLRILCTKSQKRAHELAMFLGKTNKKRQTVVDEVLTHAREFAQKQKWKGAIVLAHESYHEGVIGLAAGKLVEEFYRPAIVLSRGPVFSKASARSISGFNIIEAIRKVEYLLEGAGGHPMAAGFKIRTENLLKFSGEFEKVAAPLLSDEVLQRKLKVDLEIGFDSISDTLMDKLKNFEPTGIGNPTPTFQTSKVNIIDARSVGTNSKHLKLKLESGGLVFNAIAFNLGKLYSQLSPNCKADIVFNISEDSWNGYKSLQLKIKDIHLT